MTTAVFCVTERVILGEKDICVTSGLSVNGRLFVSPYEHLDALVGANVV
jgi:hypothetical protein